MKISEFRKFYSEGSLRIQSYIHSEKNDISEADVIKWLRDVTPKYISNKVSIVDEIDYQKLIYIYVKYKNNQTIQDMINQLFNNISQFYYEKNQYLIKVK